MKENGVDLGEMHAYCSISSRSSLFAKAVSVYKGLITQPFTRNYTLVCYLILGVACLCYKKQLHGL